MVRSWAGITTLAETSGWSVMRLVKKSRWMVWPVKLRPRLPKIQSTGPCRGGAQAPLWYFTAVGAQALTRTFPFSQAMSVTRREFYLGTLLTAALTSALLAAVFVVGGLVERAPNGFGFNGYFFALDWLWGAGPLMAGLFYFAMAMLFFVVGITGAAVYKRFGNVWLTTGIIVIALLLIGALWVIGQADAWGTVFGWFAESGVGLLVAIMAGLAAVLAAASFPALRRMVP